MLLISRDSLCFLIYIICYVFTKNSTPHKCPHIKWINIRDKIILCQELNNFKVLGIYTFQNLWLEWESNVDMLVEKYWINSTWCLQNFNLHFAMSLDEKRNIFSNYLCLLFCGNVKGIVLDPHFFIHGRGGLQIHVLHFGEQDRVTPKLDPLVMPVHRR